MLFAGEEVGTEETTLLSAHLPAHSHTILTTGQISRTTSTTGQTLPMGVSIIQPSLVLAWTICITSGIFPSQNRRLLQASDGGFLGEMRFQAYNFGTGFALANGQLLPIAQNQALFSLLGTSFGGNGVVRSA